MGEIRHVVRGIRGIYRDKGLVDCVVIVVSVVLMVWLIGSWISVGIHNLSPESARKISNLNAFKLIVNIANR